MSEAAHDRAVSSGHEPFLSPLPLLSVALFVLNNFWWKWAYPGWLVGKLSDVCACFFMPLYLAWMLAALGACRWSVQRRVRWTAWATVVVFTAVKLTTPGSLALNAVVERITVWLPIALTPNRTDPSDLVALPVVWLAVRFARDHMQRGASTIRGRAMT